MKIYVDLIFLINYLFDFILLWSVSYILRRNVDWKKIILGAFFGSLSFIFIFISINNMWLFIFKFFLACLMILVSFGYKSFDYFIKNVIYLYLVSMVMGGGIYFLKGNLNISYILILFISLLIYFGYMLCFKNMAIHYANTYKCELFYDDKMVGALNAFLDTGNKLKDPYSNKSIILVRKNVINCDNKRVVYVPYNTLNNHGLLKCLSGYRIMIDKKESDNFLVGLSENELLGDGIDCVISTKLLEGLR